MTTEEKRNRFEKIRGEVIPEIVQSYSWEEEIEEGFEYNEWDWYDDYGYTTGYQAEYEAAEILLKELGLPHDEDSQTDLMDELEISCGY